MILSQHTLKLRPGSFQFCDQFVIENVSQREATGSKASDAEVTLKGGDEMRPQRLRVLIADDCADLRKVLLLIATEMGAAEASLAADGVECTQLLDAQRDDLMIVDLQMPFIGGQTILEFFKYGELRHPEEWLSFQPIYLRARNWRLSWR